MRMDKDAYAGSCLKKAVNEDGQDAYAGNCLKKAANQMKCSGVVASVEGGRAKVVIGHKEGCSGCGKCGRFRNMTINAQNDIGAAAGDRVLLDISDKKFNLSLLLLYILPLAGLCVGVIGGYLGAQALDIKPFDIIAVLCGIIISMMVYLLVWAFRRKIDNKPTAYIISQDKE